MKPGQTLLLFCCAATPGQQNTIFKIRLIVQLVTVLLHRMFFLFCLQKGKAGFVHNRAILRDKFCPYTFNMLAYLEK